MNNPENFSLKKDILIINNISNDLHELTIFLVKQGYKVRSERNGKQAIKTAETTLPDLILLESRMPEMDGYQICQQLKASFRTKDIPVIFVSTSNAIVDRVRAFEVGGVDCITQPFQVEEVLARIENQLRLSRLCKQILEQNALLTKELEDCKRVEAELRENKHLLSAIIDTHPNVVYVYDLIEQRSFYHNRELYTSIGYTSEEVIEMGAAILPNLMHPEDLATFPDYIKQFETATEGEVFEFEYRMKHKNGEYRWFYSQDTLFVRDKEGKPKQILGAATDITERKRMEEALRLSEERWQLAVCGNNDGIYDWNINTGEAFLSTQLTQMLGYENHELRHHFDTWRNLLHPDDVDRVMNILQAYLDRKLEQYVVEYRLRCKNGSYKWILARGQAQWDNVGKPIRMVGSHKDISERKLAELELHRREQEVRALVENSPDVIGRFDRQLRHLYVNPAAEIATGLPPEAFIGKTHRDLGMPEEIVTFFQDALQSVFNTGKERLIEFGFPTPNGIQYYESRIVPEFNPDRTIETVLKVARNITERRLAEEALQKSNNILRSVIDSTPDIVLVKDKQGRYVVANSALVRWLSQPMEEVIGKDDTAFFEPEIARQFMEADKRIMTTGESITYEEVLPEKGIMQMWLTTKCPWRDADGNILGVVAISRDISDAYRQATQRKLAEQKLRETTFLYQQILDAIPDFILCKGSQSRIIYANKAFRDYYGMTMEQLQGIIDSPIVNPDYTQQYVKDDAYVFNTGQTLAIEEPVVRFDGIERLFSTIKSAIRDSNGQVIQTVGVSRDITEQKFAEVALRQSEAQYRAKVQELETAYRELQNTQAQLIQAEKMSSLGQMLAGIAHEINNPTSFIYGNITPAIEYAEDLLKIVELYRQYYPDPVAEIVEQLEVSDADFIAEDFPKLLVSIKEGANRISQIVLSLRNFSRLDEKERQRVDIHEGIDNTLLLLKHRLKQQPSRPEIQVIKEYGELPLVEGYPSQLNQVFMNILSNAIDALEDDNGLGVMDNRQKSANDPLPTIRIYSEVNDNNSVTIRIADNGMGMNTEIQQNVFNPFFTTKPLGKGTGLGLAISYQIVVEKHLGRLECFSTLGQGTEFLISLPIESSRVKN